MKEQAEDVLEQLWPVILVVGGMMALQWLVVCQFGKAKASAYVLPGYLALATAFAVKHLHSERHVDKVRRYFRAFSRWVCFHGNSVEKDQI